MVTDSENPQTLFCGTPPTPVSSGTVFLKMRNAALRGDTQNTGWAELERGAADRPPRRGGLVSDEPSLGTIFTERQWWRTEIGMTPSTSTSSVWGCGFGTTSNRPSAGQSGTN